MARGCGPTYGAARTHLMAGGGVVVYRRGLPLLQQANLKDLKTSLNLRSLPILRGRGVAPLLGHPTSGEASTGGRGETALGGP